MYTAARVRYDPPLLVGRFWVFVSLSGLFGMTGSLRGSSATSSSHRRRCLVRAGLAGLCGVLGLSGLVTLAALAGLAGTDSGRPGLPGPWARGGTLALATFRPDPGTLWPHLSGIRIVPLRHRTFRFEVAPPIWQVRLDGRLLAGEAGTPLAVRVGPGPHTVVFEHSWVFPERFDIAATDPGRTLRARLRWRPVTLLVRVAPREARASYQFLAPRFLATRPPAPANLPQVIRLGPRVREVPEARIRVYAVGYRHEERDVRLVPGERVHVPVLIRPLVGRLSDDELARR